MVPVLLSDGCSSVSPGSSAVLAGLDFLEPLMWVRARGLFLGALLGPPPSEAAGVARFTGTSRVESMAGVEEALSQALGAELVVGPGAGPWGLPVTGPQNPAVGPRVSAPAGLGRCLSAAWLLGVRLLLGLGGSLVAGLWGSLVPGLSHWPWYHLILVSPLASLWLSWHEAARPLQRAAAKGAALCAAGPGGRRWPGGRGRD